MKIGIVGSGMVGSAAANAMVLRGVGREIVLVDLNMKRAQAEADDILHAAPFSNTLDVRAGTYEDLADSRVVVITAGVAQRPGETRLQLLSRNSAVFRQIVPQILTHAPDAVLLVATNPVDIMTHLTAAYAAEFGVSPHRVLGSGTTLDTARFRAILGRRLGVDPSHVHAYVIGEHGDSEVLAWSQVTVGTVPLDAFCHQQGIDLNQEARDEIDHAVRHAAYHIIEGKGATWYGIGMALAHITNVILRDQRSVLTVCSPMDEVAGITNVTCAMPSLVGGEGVFSTLLSPLPEHEMALLANSARVLREALDGLEATEGGSLHT